MLYIVLDALLRKEDAEEMVIEIPKAMTVLKYFCENAPQYHIVAAGSLLGMAMHKGTSFPVGKVDFLHLYPLNFFEFLNAGGESKLAELLSGNDYELINSFATKTTDWLRLRQIFLQRPFLNGIGCLKSLRGRLRNNMLRRNLRQEISAYIIIQQRYDSFVSGKNICA